MSHLLERRRAGPQDGSPHNLKGDRSASRFAKLTAVGLGTVCLAIACVGSAWAQDADTKPASADKEAAVAAKRKEAAVAFQGLSDQDKKILAERQNSVARLDNLMMKGFDIPVVPFEVSMLEDAGGVRSTLAESGWSFDLINSLNGADNLLKTHPTGGTQSYWGQIPSGQSSTNLWVMYDLSRLGVPDGQLEFGGTYDVSSWQPYGQNRHVPNDLWWYQTAFDKALEIKVGYYFTNLDWIGTIIGGNLVNPLGANASIPFEMGMTTSTTSQPSARVTWNIGSGFYNETGVLRSLPINGPTQNPQLDDVHFNGSGLDWNVPNGKLLAMDEFGYKVRAHPGQGQTWLRAGVMYNESSFVDYSKFGVKGGVPGFGTKADITAEYVLADMQLEQFAPSSIFSAYRGLYVGGSFMNAPEKNLAFYRYFEGRAYVVGPFESRPLDQIAFSYSYSDVSHHLADTINSFSAFTNIHAVKEVSSITGTYTAHVYKGIFFTAGLSYTDNPTITYQRGQKDSALNLVSTMFTNF